MADRSGGHAGAGLDPHPDIVEIRSDLIWQPRLIGLVAICDAATILASGILSHIAAAGPPAPLRLGAMVLTALLALTLFQRLWIYSVPSLGSFIRQTGKVLIGLGAAFAVLMALAYLLSLDQTLPRDWLLGWVTLAAAMLTVLRSLWARLIARWARSGRLVRRTVIVGGGPQAEELLAALERSADSGVEILGLFDDRGEDRSPDRVGRTQKLGNFEHLVDFCRTARIDLLIVTLPATAEERLLSLLKKLWVLPVDVRLSAQTSKLRLRPRAYSYIGGIPVLPLFDKPLSDWSFFLKSVEDRVLGILLLIALSPIMALVALAVRLDSRGPILFRQKRYGFNNELIEVYKFRSMYVDQSDADATRLVTKGDARVTRVGRFIRRTSLDELPQLFNVLKGDLSLVGPRPHALAAKSENRLYQDVVDGYFARHRIKPGLTGWAQINGWRGETDTLEKIERRVEHDIYYIDNWSILFDLTIIALTPFALLKTENAY